MSTIQDFYAVATERDFARQHQFRITDWVIEGEDVLALDGTTGEGAAKHTLYLETAQLPGREITNVPVPFMGLSFNVGGLASYSGSAAYAVSFRCDSMYYLRSVMEHHTRRVFNDMTSVGDYNIRSDKSYLTMALLDKYLQPIQYYSLIGTQLINTGTISYNLGDTGQPAKVDATLSYHFWVQGDYNTSTANAAPTPMAIDRNY